MERGRLEMQAFCTSRSSVCIFLIVSHRTSQHAMGHVVQPQSKCYDLVYDVFCPLCASLLTTKQSHLRALSLADLWRDVAYCT